VRIHLGIDDTDSLSGGCTTKIATDLVAALATKGVEFLDYPNLIRLNPNVPWKTRGNGAVCLRIESGLSSQQILELAVEEIERSSRLTDPGTDPGLVIVEDPVPTSVTEFAAEALTRIVSPAEATSVIRAVKAEAVGFGSGQGIIGALGAIGTQLNRDHTFELIAYRSKRYIGRPRCIDSGSVFQMNEETREVTFNNIDPESQRILITPRGPDPILCGVRGETPEAVRNAFRILRIREPVDAWMIFRTNQGTDAHLARNSAISRLRDNCAVVVEGTVKMMPCTIPGGHVIFLLEDQTGQVHCAAYEPTGRFREVVKRLEPGDRVRAFGGVRAPENGVPRTLNLEKLEILTLVSRVTKQNPVCGSCGKRMKSAGKEKGFRCRRCKSRASSKIQIETPRELEERRYLPPPRAHRHLTKPEVRYGREHSGTSTTPASDWHFP
jgi:tRNA(Ile2)-agmatinylcytidine synthase